MTNKTQFGKNIKYPRDFHTDADGNIIVTYIKINKSDWNEAAQHTPHHQWYDTLGRTVPAPWYIIITRRIGDFFRRRLI